MNEYVIPSENGNKILSEDLEWWDDLPLSHLLRPFDYYKFRKYDNADEAWQHYIQKIDLETLILLEKEHNDG